MQFSGISARDTLRMEGGGVSWLGVSWLGVSALGAKSVGMDGEMTVEVTVNSEGER